MRPGDGRAVHMAVEDVHEDRDPRQRRVGEPELSRRHAGDDHRHPSIGRRDHEPLAHRHGAGRITEEVGAPRRQDGADPAERRPDPAHDEGDHREDRDERPALPVDGHELSANRRDDGHGSMFPRKSPPKCTPMPGRSRRARRATCGGGVTQAGQHPWRGPGQAPGRACAPASREPRPPRAGVATGRHRPHRAPGDRHGLHARRSRHGRAR